MLLTSKRSIRLCVFILLLIALLSHLFASGAATSLFVDHNVGLAKIENPEKASAFQRDTDTGAK
jgi:hypothetical protein